MKVEIIQLGEVRIAEVNADTILITKSQDGLDILGQVYYQDVDRIIMHKKNITPDFFDLKTGIAGEILQKFSTYRVKLAIVGDFSNLTSKSLTDFIFESNKLGHVNFVPSREEAIEKLAK